MFAAIPFPIVHTQTHACLALTLDAVELLVHLVSAVDGHVQHLAGGQLSHSQAGLGEKLRRLSGGKAGWGVGRAKRDCAGEELAAFEQVKQNFSHPCSRLAPHSPDGTES